jgi:hypothetical protein
MGVITLLLVVASTNFLGLLSANVVLILIIYVWYSDQANPFAYTAVRQSPSEKGEAAPILRDWSSIQYDWDSISVCALTWNVAAMPIGEDFDASPLLTDAYLGCDLLVIGLQEIVDLSVMNVVFTGSATNARAETWKKVLLKSLKKVQPKQDYEVVGEAHFVGVQLVVFALISQLENVQEVRSASVGVGVFSVLGNKGAVGIRLQLHGSTFCFICAHLAAHRAKVSERNLHYRSIADNLKFLKSCGGGAGVGSSDNGGGCGGQVLPVVSLFQLFGIIILVLVFGRCIYLFTAHVG